MAAPYPTCDENTDASIKAIMNSIALRVHYSVAHRKAAARGALLFLPLFFLLQALCCAYEDRYTGVRMGLFECAYLLSE